MLTDSTMLEEPANVQTVEFLSTELNDSADFTSEMNGFSESQAEVLCSMDVLEIPDNTNNYNELSCTICNDVFFEKIDLQRHYIKHINNKPYQCSTCDKSFFTKNNLEKHISLHSVTKPFSCDVCGKTFISESKFQIHARKHSFQEYVCNACFEEFQSEQLLEKHEKTHANLQDDMSYPCIMCDLVFVFKKDLEDHLNSHEKIRPFVCELCKKECFFSFLLHKHMAVHAEKDVCSICGEAMPNKNLLCEHEKDHIRVKFNCKTSQVYYGCDLCPSTFVAKPELENHYDTKHKQDRFFNCEYCGKTFFFYFLLQVHRTNEHHHSCYMCPLCRRKYRNRCDFQKHYKSHFINQQYECPDCNRMFKTKWLMKQHSYVHSTEKLFSCGYCGLGFNRKTNLERHFMRHTDEKPHQCPICNCKYSRKHYLDMHIRNHDNKDSNYVCYLCDECFLTQAILTRHLRKVHATNLPNTVHTCEVCNREFKHYPSFLRHIKLHTGDRKFKCKYCDKAYIQKKNLMQHHLSYHSDMPVDLPFQCNYCTEAYTVMHRLVAHHVKHHPNETLQVYIQKENSAVERVTLPTEAPVP